MAILPRRAKALPALLYVLLLSASVEALEVDHALMFRFAIKKFDDLVKDFQQLITEVVEPWRAGTSPSPPLFLIGASIGGLVVRATSGPIVTLM